MQPHVRMLEQEGAHRLKWAQQDSEPLASSESETRRFSMTAGETSARHTTVGSGRDRVPLVFPDKITRWFRE